jgi:uncharacterized membrane protein YfcA
MIAGLTTPQLLELVLLLLVTGAATGFLAGIFGVGGGAILVPVLYELFRMTDVPADVRMPLAVGTSLAIIIPTSISSFWAHRRKGAVDTLILRQWAVPVVAGVVIGSVVARYAPQELFKIVFVVVAGISAIRLLFGSAWLRFGDELPGGPIMRIYGVGIGVLSTLMGIGGGQLSNLFMTFYGRPIHQAIATSSGLGVLISIPGALGYVYAGWPVAAEYPAVSTLQFPFSLGYVSLIGAVLVMPISLLVAPLGAHVAHKLSKRRLEVAFGVFLLLVASRFVISLVTGR